eukprot:1144577-Pelagomonas_calceolata.AAC.6
MSARRDVSNVYRGNKNIILGVKIGPKEELWDHYRRSEARRVIRGPPLFISFWPVGPPCQSTQIKYFLASLATSILMLAHMPAQMPCRSYKCIGMCKKGNTCEAALCRPSVPYSDTKHASLRLGGDHYEAALCGSKHAFLRPSNVPCLCLIASWQSSSMYLIIRF